MKNLIAATALILALGLPSAGLPQSFSVFPALESTDFPSLDTDLSIQGPVGTPYEFTGNLVIRSAGIEGEEGPQGWSFGVSHEQVDLVETTYYGTIAEQADLGGFAVLETIDPEKNGGKTGIVEAIVLHFKKPITLPPNTDQIVAINKYKATIPASPAVATIKFEEGLVGSGQPVACNITFKGNTFVPDLGERKIQLKGPGGPKETACDDGLDDDGDSKIDCCDEDCAGVAPCETVETLCDDGKDNDCDGQTDAADTDCAPPECPEWALYFGPTATTLPVDVGSGPTLVISSRNAGASSGFQLGVKATTTAETTAWEFSGSLGPDSANLVELSIFDEEDFGQMPRTPNTATSAIATVEKIERGAATDPFAELDDQLIFDTAPAVGGPGFTVTYVADMSPPAPPENPNLIPATPAGAECALNEILKVTLSVPVQTMFSRGDADGDGHLNVLDPIWIIKILIAHATPKFDCEDILDANDDGVMDLSDAMALINWVFSGGPDLAAPFRTCGVDSTPDLLACTEPNCQ